VDNWVAAISGKMAEKQAKSNLHRPIIASKPVLPSKSMSLSNLSAIEIIGYVRQKRDH
jgi:hypothetical protein